MNKFYFFSFFNVIFIAGLMFMSTLQDNMYKFIFYTSLWIVNLFMLITYK